MLTAGSGTEVAFLRVAYRERGRRMNIPSGTAFRTAYDERVFLASHRSNGAG